MPEVIEKLISELLKPLPISLKLNSADLGTGSVPVYSSETQNNGIKGFCENAIFKIDSEDFQRKQYIVFGDHTRSINVVCEDFSVMDNVKVLVPIFPNLSLNYIKSQWYNKIPQLGYARHWNVARKVKIEIPVNENGDFDLERQKELAKKYQDIENKRKTLLKNVEELKKSKIVFETNNEQRFTQLSFNETFKLARGKIISKTYIYEHSGEFPVYSTQKGVYGYIDSYMREGQFLLWNTDGLAGYIKKTDGKFSFTNIVGIMIPNPEVDMQNLSLDYLKCYLEPIFREHRKGIMGINGKNEYTKINSTMIKNLNIMIPISIKEDGSFDIEKQRELAQKYAVIESIKEEIYKKIIQLTDMTVV